MTTFSEDMMDAWISENLPLPDRGVYCDVGCAGPIQYSQTAFLRDRGWTGIAIDGYAAYRPQWEGVAGAHFIHAVVSDEPECRFLLEPTNSFVSRRHESGQKVTCATLDDILKFVPKLDFLALDTEGMEFNALLSLSLSKYPPIIVSEYDSEHAGQDFRVLHHLVKMGYEVRHVTRSNILYYRG